MPGTEGPEFFSRFPMQEVVSKGLDAVLADGEPMLDVLFLWGRDCPNCDIAKRALLAAPQRFAWPGVRWLECNVHDERAMAQRFGLHGVPAFFVFRAGKKLGRITGWPGADAFADAIDKALRS